MPVTAVKPEDIIAGIFAETFELRKSYKFSHKALHEVFFNLKKDPEVGIFLEDFLFRENNVYPICDLLDEILSEMQLTGVLSKLNPILKVKKINYKDTEALETLLGSLNGEEKVKFKLLTNKFLEKIGESDS